MEQASVDTSDSGLLVSDGKLLKLNLGGNEEFDGGEGSPRLDGFIHVDSRPLPRVSVIRDIRNSLPWEWHGKVNEIRVSHVIEHFTFEEVYKVVCYWADFLVSGGLMRLYCPDAMKIAQHYVDGKLSIAEFSRLLFGDQDYKQNFHLAAYDQGRLDSLVTEAGLTIISRNPRANAYIYDLGVQAGKK